MNKLFTLTFAFITVLLLVTLAPAVSAHHSPNCYRTGYSYSPAYGGGYGYGHVQTQYWSAWNPVRLKVHYPYSSGNFAPYSAWNQNPGPYAHSYRPYRPYQHW